MFGKKKRNRKERHLSIRTKLTLSLLSIAAVLLLSSGIMLIQYSRMSNYVSSLTANNIQNLNELGKLGDDMQAYNAEIVSVLWDENLRDAPAIPTFDLSYLDSLQIESRRSEIQQRAGSLKESFSALSAKADSLQTVINSERSTLEWYREAMSPLYDDFRYDVFALSNLLNDELVANAATFDRGFYRSVIPVAVALGVGLLLILLLLLFMSIYYVKPLYRMLRGLDDYRLMGKKYGVTFDGDDELAHLNDGISEVTSENQQLRKRVSYLKETMSKLSDQ